jgi:hypothetical protein
VYVQLIQGPVADRDSVHRLVQRWEEDLRPGATGFLGSTVGITADGWLVASVRFASLMDGQDNGARPEQGGWWNEFSKCLSADPTFVDTEDAETFFGKGCDGAGFVQVMEGRTDDRDRLVSLERQIQPHLAELRPEYLGGLRIWPSTDAFVELAYFTSEELARAGESRDVPGDVGRLVRDWQATMTGLRYRDLVDVQLIPAS